MPSPGPLNRVWDALLRGGETKNADQNPDAAPAAPPLLSDADLTARLADGVFDGILLLDRQGRIRHANAVACQLLGVPYPPPVSGDLIGQTLLEATHVRALSELCAEAETPPGPREEIVRLVGQRANRTLHARATRLPPAVGGGVLLALRDETELRHLRTVRTEFVANVTHELRTPLASIRATAETLLDGAASDPQAAERFLNTIIREADRLVSLSADLLELSRAESTERDRTRFDLSALATEVAARLLAKAERRQVALRFDPAPPPPVTVNADRSEIDQVLFNLLDNAVKYTPAGGRVTLTVEPRPAAGEVAVIVADTGIGILSQDLPRIFERFWRADRARRFAGGGGSAAEGGENSQQTGGTGLGLSIVKHIVEAHKGVVRAESELGQGARFTVTLPLSAPSDAASDHHFQDVL